MWTSLVPLPYRIAIIAALFAAATGFGYVRGLEHEKHAWQQADAARSQSEDKAIAARAQANAATAIRQRDINDAITKANHEELAPVLSAIAADRVRVNSICNGPAAPAQAEGPASSHAADPPGRLVPLATEIRIRELETQVETALATGRACQAFVRANGMEP